MILTAADPKTTLKFSYIKTWVDLSDNPLKVYREIVKDAKDAYGEKEVQSGELIGGRVSGVSAEEIAKVGAGQVTMMVYAGHTIWQEGALTLRGNTTFHRNVVEIEELKKFNAIMGVYCGCSGFNVFYPEGSGEGRGEQKIVCGLYRHPPPADESAGGFNNVIGMDACEAFLKGLRSGGKLEVAENKADVIARKDPTPVVGNPGFKCRIQSPYTKKDTLKDIYEKSKERPK
jgi:hypothetical protein